MADLFTLLPSVRKGTLNPFINQDSTNRWLRNEQVGRSTIWNKSTRNGDQRLLFNDGGDGTERHIQNGIRDDVIDVLLEEFDRSSITGPAGEALAVLLARDNDWTSEPSSDDLQTVAAEVLGLGLEDYKRFTTREPLGVPVLGQPAWTPELLEQSKFGPPPDIATVAMTAHGQRYEEAPIEQINGLVEEFKRFATAHGIAASDADIHDLLAAALGSQFIVMAGPSGSGKSLMASALAAFFAKKDRRTRLEGSRFLARQEEFLGYYSHLVGEQFIAQPPLLDLLPLEALDDRKDAPIVTVEEANLSPIEGYLSALVHGLGSNETAELPFRLHSIYEDRLLTQSGELIPDILRLAPYPRFFATINVDAESPAPARKVASRACVVLTETPSIEDAMASADILSQPSIDDADGPASTILGRPSSAFARYKETGSTIYEEVLSERGNELSRVVGTESVNFRAYQKALFYIAWYVELAGNAEVEPDSPIVSTAVDNAILHFALPTLPAQQFAKAIDGLQSADQSSLLSRRMTRLREALKDQHFGPAPDFWGALS
jgi:hypothetical protein